MKDMGGVMKIAKEELKGTDMKIISSLVKTLFKLGGLIIIYFLKFFDVLCSIVFFLN
jgi:hypothetical protein